MAYLNAYTVNQYLQRALCATSGGSLAVGTAIKLTTNRKTPADLYLKVDAAGASDVVFGIVHPLDDRLLPITDLTGGFVLPLNSAMVLVRLDNDYMQGDQLKVKTTDGKWGKIGMGEVPLLMLVENGKKDDLAWAQVL